MRNAALRGGVSGTLGVIACLSACPSFAKNVDYLPTPDVASRVAAAILEPLIGKDEVTKGSPLLVESQGDIWAVYTVPEQVRKKMHRGYVSAFVIRLNKHTAAVINWGVVQ